MKTKFITLLLIIVLSNNSQAQEGLSFSRLGLSGPLQVFGMQLKETLAQNQKGLMTSLNESNMPDWPGEEMSQQGQAAYDSMLNHLIDSGFSIHNYTPDSVMEVYYHYKQYCFMYLFRVMDSSVIVTGGFSPDGEMIWLMNGLKTKYAPAKKCYDLIYNFLLTSLSYSDTDAEEALTALYYADKELVPDHNGGLIVRLLDKLRQYSLFRESSESRILEEIVN